MNICIPKDEELRVSEQEFRAITRNWDAKYHAYSSGHLKWYVKTTGRLIGYEDENDNTLYIDEDFADQYLTRKTGVQLSWKSGGPIDSYVLLKLDADQEAYEH